MRLLSQAGKLKSLYAFGGLFLLLNGVFIALEMYWFAAIPVALFLTGLALFKLDWLLLLVVALAPLSITIDNVGGGFGLTLPSDPLLFGITVVFLFKVFYELNYDKRILKHPITVVIGLQFMWMILSALMSDLPMVSWKYFIARLWFVIPFYFVAVQLFKYPDRVSKYFWLYIVPFTGVIIYTIIRHAVRGFGDEPAHWVMQPFFKDHTSYGAMLAMLIPLLMVYTVYKWDITARTLAGFFLAIFLIGVIMSYTRAAWVSLVGALGLFLLIIWRIRWWVVFAAGGVLVSLVLVFQVEIMHKLEKNRQDSSSDLAEHVESISNVATDASNLERLNRWNAAFKMFFESPVVGKGPGTYSFLYAPYQHSSDLTIISTNFGDGGNAHSEYFGPLAEQGVAGMLLFLLLVFMIYYRGIPLYYELANQDQRRVLLAAILGLTTYLIHGMLNNFLDIDKVNAIFWAFIALITAGDIYAEKKTSR